MKIQKIVKLRLIWPHKYYVGMYGFLTTTSYSNHTSFISHTKIGIFPVLDFGPPPLPSFLYPSPLI